jgi:hypothetical protein
VATIAMVRTGSWRAAFTNPVSTATYLALFSQTDVTKRFANSAAFATAATPAKTTAKVAEDTVKQTRKPTAKAGMLEPSTAKHNERDAPESPTEISTRKQRTEVSAAVFAASTTGSKGNNVLKVPIPQG